MIDALLRLGGGVIRQSHLPPGAASLLGAASLRQMAAGRHVSLGGTAWWRQPGHARHAAGAAAGPVRGAAAGQG